MSWVLLGDLIVLPLREWRFLSTPTNSTNFLLELINFRFSSYKLPRQWVLSYCQVRERFGDFSVGRALSLYPMPGERLRFQTETSGLAESRYLEFRRMLKQGYKLDDGDGFDLRVYQEN